MSKIVILLTGCVNPNGMPLTALTDTNVRAKQYYDAVQYYLSQTTVPVVFAENSNSRLGIPESDRFEMLCFDGNKDKTHGKGYGECEIIEYAINNSRLIKPNSIIIKITGRLIVKNISTIIYLTKIFPRRIQCIFHSDMKFADSRLFCCSPTFIKALTSRKKEIKDSEGIYLEHVLADQIKKEKGNFFPFLSEPQIQGISGTSGEIYKAQTHISLKNRLKFLKFQYYIYKNLKSTIS